MAWSETWLDTAVYPGLDICLAAAAQAGASTFNIYLGGRNADAAGGGWGAHVQELQARGFGTFGTWVSLYKGQGGYNLGYQDGVDADAAARNAGVELVCYDVEPDVWYANPNGVVDACRGFRDALRAKSRPSMLYGVQETLFAVLGFDRYWGTFDLGQYTNDPARGAGPAGSRALQYAQTSLAGRAWDLSHSEFEVNTTMDEATFKQWLRDVLNEGTGAGQASWSGTSRDTLSTVQTNYNLLADLSAKVPDLTAKVNEAVTQVNAATDRINQVAAKVDQIATSVGITPDQVRAVLTAAAQALP